MIAIIVGTNRPNSSTSAVCKYIIEQLDGKNYAAHLIDLRNHTTDLIYDQMYGPSMMPQSLAEVQDQKLIPSSKWWMVVPEYNGSYPGILKLFIDVVSGRKYNETFGNGKKLAITGIASGRGGNLRGIDHLTTAMNYLGFSVLPNRLPLSLSNIHVSNGLLSDEYRQLLDQQIRAFIDF